MPKDDPFYNRKPVPDEFIQDVGLTGLTKEEEFLNRERKYSVDGVDLRKFGKKANSGWHPANDPYYGRQMVNKNHLEGVGETGLTPEEEFENRERKLSVNGVDLRKFGKSANSGFHPANDPYYGRKSVAGVHTIGVGETYNTPAEDYAIRERKQSMVNFSSDPFQLVTGRGTRQSVSDQGGAAATGALATERRRSSAIDPSATHAAQASHSGYGGGAHLNPIQSRADEDEITRSSIGESSASGAANGAHAHGHTNFYDEATRATSNQSGSAHATNGVKDRHDADDVAPDQV